MRETSIDLVNGEDSVAQWPDFPWLTIMFQPRKTIRAVVDSNPNRYAILLVILVGLVNGISRVVDYSPNDRIPSSVAWLILGIFLGPLAALVGWGIFGEILRWTGSWFDGEATSDKVRAAMAWSAVPFIMSLPLWVTLLLLYGNELLTPGSAGIERDPLPLIAVEILNIILTIWWYFLFWKCYAELQQLSLLKALVAILVPGLLLTGILLGCGLLLVGMA